LLKFTSYLSIHLIFVFVLAKFTPIPFSVRFPFFTFSVSCPFYKCIYFCHFIISPMFHCSFSPPFVFSFSLKLIFVLPFLPQQTYFFQLHCLSHFSFKTSISTNIPFSVIFTTFVNPHHEFLSHSFLPLQFIVSLFFFLLLSSLISAYPLQLSFPSFLSPYYFYAEIPTKCSKILFFFAFLPAFTPPL